MRRRIIRAMAAGKYRWRTWLRGRMPSGLVQLVPKGKRDCGAHEWYRVGDHEWRCMHCDVGVSEEVPWDPADAIVKSALALRLLVETAQRRALTDAEVHRFDVVTSELLDDLELLFGVDSAPDLMAALDEPPDRRRRAVGDVRRERVGA